MAQVPGGSYQPYFTGTPQERRLRLREPNIPPDAFGVGVAKALNLFGEQVRGAGGEIRGLGRDIEGASTDIFNRAEALRKMQIDSSVRDAITSHFNNIAPDQENFMQAQGANAGPNVMQAHLNNIQQKNKAAGDAIEAQYGQYGRKLFDDQASSLTRSIFRESVGHSATESRKIFDKSIGDQIQALEDQARLTSDPVAYDDIIRNKLPDLIRQQSGIWGYNQTINDYNLKDATSRTIAARANGLIDRNQSEDAAKLFMDYGSQLLGRDRDPLQHRLDSAIVTDTSRKAYEGIRTGKGLELGKGIVDTDRMEAAVYAIEGYTPPNKYGPLITSGPYAGQKAMGMFQVMQGNLQSWLKEAGMPPMTEQQFMNSAAAQRQLFRTRIEQYMKETGSANEAASMWFTGQPMSKGAMRSDGHWTGLEYVTHLNAELAKTATRQDVDTVSRVMADQFKDINPNAPGQVADHTIDMLNKDKARDHNDLNILKLGVHDYLSASAGKTVFDMHDMEADQKGSALITAIRRNPYGAPYLETIEREIRNRIANDNDPSPARQKNYDTAVGMSNDLNKQKEFASTDCSHMDLQQSHRLDLERRQKLILHGKYDTERTKAFMHDVDSVLRDSNIHRSDTDKAANDQYLMIQGMLSQKLEQMAINNEPIPTDITKREALIRPMLREVAGSWSPWRFAHPAFEPPPGVLAEMNRRFRAASGQNRDMYPEEVGQTFQNALRIEEWQKMLRDELGPERAAVYGL